MILYKKYLFKDFEQYSNKIKNLPEDLEYTEILLPNVVTPEEDTEDDLTSVAVDMLWQDITESPYGWKTYEINPAEPWLKVLGIDQE